MYAIKTISKTDTELLDQAEALWRAFYDGMSAQGLQLPLTGGGETLWRRSIEGALERSMHLLLAIQEDKAVGFALGSLRLLPEYLGSGVIGFVNGLYVEAACREEGLGRALSMALDEWFSSRKVSSIELQVLQGNQAGIQFWESMGFEAELLQMRRKTKIR
jgi:ribosomal protein S18 acetylase RimI-like enzyme